MNADRIAELREWASRGISWSVGPANAKYRAIMRDILALLDEAEKPSPTPQPSAVDLSGVRDVHVTDVLHGGGPEPQEARAWVPVDQLKPAPQPPATQGASVSREWLYQTAGELSTFRFSNQHPEAALTWLGNMLRSIGIRVEAGKEGK